MKSASANAGDRRVGLRLTGVSKRFGGEQALDRVDFHVPPGEIHCLAGENGSGKSTLIKIVCGVLRPDRGARIEFDGVTYPALTPRQAHQLGVQVIWQDLALFPELSVAENIAFEEHLGRWPAWVRARRLHEIAGATLARLGVDLDLRQPARALPIAGRQVVAICRALAADARIVFMDEPTASLTNAEANALFDVVRRLSRDGISVVFVSHRLAEVFEIAERVTVLRDGRQVGVFRSADIDHRRLAELMTGRVVTEEIRGREESVSPVVLETRGLTRHGEFTGVSLAVHRGEILGITGLLGAGRTELGLTLFGLARPHCGHVYLNGAEIALRSNRDAVKAGISYVSEDRLSLGLIQAQPTGDNLVLAVLDRLSNRLGLLDGARRERTARTWIERLDIKTGQLSDSVSTLSGGNQQRVVLGKWLATEPAVLILDSPTVGVDVGARAGIFEIVHELAAAGMAIILISDELPEVHAHADRVLHMRDGEIVGTHRPQTYPLAALEAAVHA